VIAAALLGGGVLCGRQWIFIDSPDGPHRRDIARLRRTMQDGISHDSFVGYQAACAAGEKVVTDLDPNLYSAHAFLAYADALRWGEYGEDVERLAKEHLSKAKAAKIEHTHLMAAEAYLKFFSGDVDGAKAILEPVVADKSRRSPLLMSTLGIIELRSGDLEKASRHLKDAQNLAPADPRINAALAEVIRRQGDTFYAATYYDAAFRYERDHARAKLGVVQMAIDTGKWETAEKFVTDVLTAVPPPSARQLAVAHMAKAVILDKQGHSAEADREAALALSLKAPSADLYLTLARRLLLAGKKGDAAAAIRDAPVRPWERPGLERDFASLPALLVGAIVSEPDASSPYAPDAGLR